MGHPLPRLQAGHLRPKDRVLNGSHYALLGAQTELFSATRARKNKFEVPERLPVVKDLHGHLMRCCDGMGGMLEASSPRT